MTKSLATNLIAIGIILVGHFIPVYSQHILSIGHFALSGALTNWLAIHMLFEKVPGLYGSGVIPSRFTEFKATIKSLIMEQFFTPENIERFFSQHSPEDAEKREEKRFDALVKTLNYDKIFTELLEVVQNSSFGGMLGMFGGVQALLPLKDDFTEKIKGIVHDVTTSPEFFKTMENTFFTRQKIESVVQRRLEEFTPQMVKEIIQEIIREHLGWLVVWGGVFGGLIGLVMSFVS